MFPTQPFRTTVRSHIHGPAHEPGVAERSDWAALRWPPLRARTPGQRDLVTLLSQQVITRPLSRWSHTQDSTARGCAGGSGALSPELGPRGPQ